ncbi:MAG: polysaccharide export protein [Gammaproteobacteria bacterium]|nr:polysaccharide export protein [Gammaproteobacteria bacterium]
MKIIRQSQFILFFFLFLVPLLAVGADSEEQNAASSRQNTENPQKQTQSYRLAASDKISIRVFNEENLNLETTLGNTGIISYPLLGDLKLKGLTLNEIESLITKGLKGPYLLDPRVTVTMVEYRSFFINGEVTKPGGYPFQPGLTVRKSIALAGGLSENASKEKLSIIREIDASKTPKKAEFDTEVNAGDIVIVMEYQQVYLNGEVKKPGGYHFKPGLTLRKAVALAGGFTDRASHDKIFVIHEGSSDQAPVKGKLEDIVQPGDIITIKQSFF